MSILLVDLGNSALKWVNHGAGLDWQPRSELYESRELPDILQQCWSGLGQPLRVVYVSVAGPEKEAQLQAWTGQHWDIPLQAVTAETEAFGVTNGYRQPGQLGADRWAAMLGARHMTAGPCCIVSCGTATTLDLLDGDGHHLGGVILPGLSLMTDSLAQGTANLVREAPATGADPAMPPLGRTTADGITLGTQWAQAGAIRLLVSRYRSLVDGELSVMVCGGAADQVLPLLDEGPINYVPDLVLRGLVVVASTC